MHNQRNLSQELLAPHTTEISITHDCTCISEGLGVVSGRHSVDGNTYVLGGAWHADLACDNSMVALDSEGHIPRSAATMPRARFVMDVLVRRPDQGTQSISCCRVPLEVESMPKERFATMLCKIATGAVDAGLLINAFVFDNATYAEAVDGALLGHAPSLAHCVLHKCPFFQEMKSAGRRRIKYVPYLVMMFRGRIVYARTHPPYLGFAMSGNGVAARLMDESK